MGTEDSKGFQNLHLAPTDTHLPKVLKEKTQKEINGLNEPHTIRDVFKKFIIKVEKCL